MTNTAVQRGREEIRRYFEVCGFAPDDSVSVVWKARSGKLGWTHVLVSEADKPILGHQLVDCWISANPMRPPVNEQGVPNQESRGTAADVYAVRALWADLDVGPGKMASYADARKVIDEVSEIIGAEPVLVLASGHGLQPRWRLAGGINADDFARILLENFGALVQKVAAQRGGKADSVYDLPRIIRAPQTRNCKDSQAGIEVKVRFTGTDDVVDIRHLMVAMDTYLHGEKPEEPVKPSVEKEQNVDLSRGNRYAKAVVDAIKAELADIADWPVGKTDERGRGWEKIQADAAYRLAELVKADWNSLTENQAKRIFADAAPVDGSWTIRDVAKKWKSQWPRAEAAEPPAKVDDPLSPGFGASERVGGDASPHSGAPDAGGEGRGSGATGAGAGSLAATAAGGADGAVPADRRDGGRDGEARDPFQWRKFEWNDDGNAERIVRLFGSSLRWSPLLDRWLRYDGGAWRETKTGGEKAALELFRQLGQLEAGFYSTEEYSKGRGKVSSPQLDFLEWVQDQKSTAKVKAAAQMVKFSAALDASPAEFDVQPMLLNAPNGIIDLFSGELLEHDPALMLRRQIPVRYDPNAKARRWDAFLERVMPSADMRDYLQRIIGYSITGRTDEQVVFFHVGPPATGKSVFLRIIEAVLGEFSRVVPPTTLLNKKMEQHPTDVMGMEGRRVLQASETPEGARLDEALVKRLSGEETVSARGMGQDFRDFRIVGKVHLVTNHDPHISDDPAVHRRLHYIPWTVQIPVQQRNTMLAEQIIREELEGVLAWAVRGTRRWLEDRLERPMEAEMARAEYIASEDEFGQFVEEELIVGSVDAFTPSRELYRRYRFWCEGRGIKPMSAVALGRKLSRRGIPPARTKAARGFACYLTVPESSRPDPLM